ncbi:IS30 family transposase [Bulleidia extructa]
MRCFKQLTKTDRLKIELLCEKKTPAKEIADILRIHISTVYREVKRGKFYKKVGKSHKKTYSCDLGQLRHEAKMKTKGVAKKIARDPRLARYIEEKIADDKYSPACVLGEIKRKHLKFKESICVTTLYHYIEAGVFRRVTNKDLIVKGKRKRSYKKVKSKEYKRLVGTSIEQRPEYILSRDEFGHWEMDTVKGKLTSKSSLLVMTERKTRKEIIVKLEHHCAEDVVNALNELEKKIGTRFSIMFKSITCDNGVEFSYASKIEQSCLNRTKKRTNLYFCHPYTSCERGSNEVANKLIRKFIPKGTEFDDYPESKFKRIEKWINTYPRKIFDYRSSEEMFIQELSSIP